MGGGRGRAWVALAILAGAMASQGPAAGQARPVPASGRTPADSVFTASDGTRFRVEVVAAGVDAPSALEFLPDGRLLLAERRLGRLSILDVRAGGLPVPVRGLPSMHALRDAGLHDVLVTAEAGVGVGLYLSYSAGDSTASRLEVARARLVADSLVSVERIFSASPAMDTSFHYGGSMALVGEHLFVTVGDHHYRNQAQDLSSDNGKMVRLRADGSVPGDNPFRGAGANPGIWSMGHRNAQGIAVHPDTGELWIVEHGPLGGDELNLVVAGANYGWPRVTDGVEYDGTPVGDGLRTLAGLERPIHVFPPRTAPSGLMIYDGDAFPGWRGNFFVGAMGEGLHLRRLVVRGRRVLEEDELLAGWGWRVRSVAQGPDGRIYVGTDYGLVVRLVPVQERP